MALKKSDLYRSLWASCDELRGGMDASQYKDFILTLLFVKYVSDKAAASDDALLEVPEGASFADLVALRGDKEIGEKVNKLIAKLDEANELGGILQVADFNAEEKLGTGKELVDRLSALISIFDDLDFSGSRAEGDDLLGDAYEYLMRHFATESGKSKGQFYTPAEVSRVLAKVVGIGPQTSRDKTVYDPTCGSGSLLLKAADEAPRGMTIYAQEKDNATWALARMNMILHGHETAELRKGDTITNPQFVDGDGLRRFDFAVSNPPFSIKSWSNGLEREYDRFAYGRPPEKNGDYAFLLHVLASLKSTGKAAVILPHGVLFRGGAEAAIRAQLLRRGFVKGVIGLPANLFYGTTIPACVVVLDKENARARTGVFMVNASTGFAKDGPKNRLRSRDIHKIVDVFTRQATIDGYSRMVPMGEIASDDNAFSLNIARYVDSSEPEDVQDLHAHLHGGIPATDIDALADYWQALPSLRDQLFAPNRPGYVDLRVDISAVRQTVLESGDFAAFSARVRDLLDEWWVAARPQLAAIDAGTRPNELIAAIGDDLLARFRDVPLLDEYDVYEQLLSYWHATLHDDVFLVMREGWRQAAAPRAALAVGKDKNGKPKYEDADLQFGTGARAERWVLDLIPPALVVARYLADEQRSVDELNAKAETASVSVTEYVEEHLVEDGLLADAAEDGKVTKALVDRRLKLVRRQVEDGFWDLDELTALAEAAALFKAEADAKKAARDAQFTLDVATLEQYAKLSESDVQTLVLDDKWHETVRRRVMSEVEGRTLALVERLQQLGERYACTVGEIEADVARLDARVAMHLAAMGVA